MFDHDSVLEPGNLLMVQERERFLVREFRRQGITSLRGVRAFEAGCAGGYHLRLLVQWGANPADVAGIDRDPAAIAEAQRLSPGIRVHEGSAEHIPEPDERYDLALAFTLFSSVRDEDESARIAAELFRITRPGGFILVHDLRRGNPRNRAVHAIGRDDIRRWFPKCPMRTRSITLAPPLARPVGRWAPWLYGPLATIPLLRSHAMYVLRRPALPLVAAE
ncbi:MAG: class I SAM-dependent methyltransferase [Hyphomicrobiales bacterium]